MNVIDAIRRYNAAREPERLGLKYRKMRSDPFNFMRGTCHLFYGQLPRGGVFRSAPAVWSCGDLHLENFGSYKGDNRLPYFDVNDFDEAILAPASWDLIRMLTSIRVGAKSLGLKAAEARVLCESVLQAYGDALGHGKAQWVEPQTADGLIRALLDGLRGRSRKAFLDGRSKVKGRRRTLNTDGGKALPVSELQRDRVEGFMAAFAISQRQPAFFKVLDVARRIAGTGSLGVDRYVILVEGKGSPDANYLLDLKEALPSSLAARVKIKQPKWTTEAHRVVELQRRLQAVSMAFSQPVIMGDKSYVLRGLQPTEDRVALDRTEHSFSQIEKTLATMGRVVAWGQLRSAGRQGSATADELIEFGLGRKWRPKLLEASEDCAGKVFKDAETFAVAYDDGELGRKQAAGSCAT
jgi:uncharacterized protein (DUF2252 family)